LGLGRIDPRIRRLDIDALALGFDPGTQSRHWSYIGDNRRAGSPDGRRNMDEAQWWLIDIIGPAILLIVLIWLVMRNRSSRDDRLNRDAEAGTRNLYAEEETRRREGTDDL